ncbi:MAG: hypothetical protein ACFFB2_09530 [Promethearchaeota archaeon]
MTLDIREDVDQLHKAELELTCPWCHTHTIQTTVNHNTLRLRCRECNMNAFVTRIPSNKKINDYISRRSIS